jgi:gluconate 5-dehydrogenase
MAKVIIEENGPLILDRTPLGRFGGDEDLKGLAVLLASDASRHMTGQIIAVDGGMTAY